MPLTIVKHTHTEDPVHTHSWSEVFCAWWVDTRSRLQSALSKIKISLCSWTWRYESSFSSQLVARNIKRLSAPPPSLSLPAYIGLNPCISILARLWDQTHSQYPRGPSWKWIAITDLFFSQSFLIISLVSSLFSLYSASRLLLNLFLC